MRVAVIGRSDALFHAVEELRRNGHTVPVIVTSKAAPEYGKDEVDFRDLASRIGAKYFYTASLSERLNDFKGVEACEIAISANYTSILSSDFIDLFPLGILNAHGGDLPRYRGNACQAWAIFNGESRIGLCIHKMIGGELDSGDIIARDYLEISENTKVGDALQWITDRVPNLFVEAISKLETDPGYILEKQSHDPDLILRCYPRKPEDGAIEWSCSASEIVRLINASGKPFPGAFCYFNGTKMTVWDAGVYIDNEKFLAVPGQVVDITDAGVVVATGACSKVIIKNVQYNDMIGSAAKLIKSKRARLENG